VASWKVKSEVKVNGVAALLVLTASWNIFVTDASTDEIDVWMEYTVCVRATCIAIVEIAGIRGWITCDNSGCNLRQPYMRKAEKMDGEYYRSASITAK